MTSADTPGRPLPTRERPRPPRRDVTSLVLDEVTYPVNYGWIEAEPVWAAIRARAERTNHAYETGVRARRGIDF